MNYSMRYNKASKKLEPVDTASDYQPICMICKQPYTEGHICKRSALDLSLATVLKNNRKYFR